MTTGPSSSGSLADTIRDIHIHRRSGVLAQQAGAEGRRLFFVQGELHVPEGHPLAQQLAGFLDAEVGFGTLAVDVDATLAGAERPALPQKAQQGLKTLMSRIASFFSSAAGEYLFHEGRDGLPSTLVGPLPTGYLVMELTATDGGSSALLRELCGEDTRYCQTRDRRRLTEAYWLETREAFLLSRVDPPATVAAVLRQVAMERTEALRGLNRLVAAGLIEVDEEKPAEREDTLVTSSHLTRFLERVGSGLEAEALETDPETHRQHIGDLVAHLAARSFYELLEIPPEAPEAAIYGAYEQLARRVHPMHARRLGLQEKTLELLFERATEAYLTLSDPRRRADYDRRMDVGILSTESMKIDLAVLNERLARDYYDRAKLLVSTEEYHSAHEVLIEAVRRDPRPEYLGLLGDVQARNPNWLHRALESYRRALDEAPNSLDWRLALARLSEEVGNHMEAQMQFQEVLERYPRQPEAMEALRRLEGSGSRRREGGKGGFFRRLFGG